MRSGVGSIEDFKESTIWLDIVDELDMWLGQLHGQLENHGLEASHRELDRLGGCCEAVKNFKDILDVLEGLAAENEDGRDAILNNLIKGGQNG